MGRIVKFGRRQDAHVRFSSEDTGRGISSGQSLSGSLAESQDIACSSVRLRRSAPFSIAARRLPSEKMRELTVDNGTPSTSAYLRATLSKRSMLFIKAISVILPDKSTANLPDARKLKYGHPSIMNLQAILARIERRIDELGVSAHHVSKAAGVPDAIRNLQRVVKSGKGGITVRTLSALAPALNMTTAQLLGEEVLVRLDHLTVEQLIEEREILLRRLTDVQNEIAKREQQSMSAVTAGDKSRKARVKSKSR